MKRNVISLSRATAALEKLTDDDLSAISFAFPWQAASGESNQEDADGFPISGASDIDNRQKLQEECWEKFQKSPHVSTAIRGLVGRLTGLGYEVSSEISQIQEVIDEVELDPRNRLYCFWPKFVGRAFIEGELFLAVTVHPGGFTEVDFVDPSTINGAGDDGILYHPTKTLMPLAYNIVTTSGTVSSTVEQIPSIFVAYFPELTDLIYAPGTGFTPRQMANSRSRKKKFAAIGGFNRFIIAWDRGFLTRRNVSYLRTILEWLNYYENLKKYEIDHKKSSGSYLWVVTMTDAKAFRLWLSLSEDEKRKTGIMAKKTPGGTLMLPPGMELECKNPSLPRISDTDTDILHMVTSGLNEPEDVSTGQSKGTFASVKASRGPMSDRISDEIAYFEKFLRHDFWGSIFFLRSAVSDFPSLFKRRVAVDFKDQEPVFANVQKRPQQLIDIAFPVSEVIDAEARARAYLGVKHGSTYETLGIPNAEIAKKLGFANYRRLRLDHATEEEKYPELVATLDAEANQENKVEPPKKKKPAAKKGEE